MENKKYIISANVDIRFGIEISNYEAVTYERMAEAIKSVLKSDYPDMSVDVKEARIDEVTDEHNILPERYKKSLYNAFTGGKG